MYYINLSNRFVFEIGWKIELLIVILLNPANFQKLAAEAHIFNEKNRPSKDDNRYSVCSYLLAVI